VLHAERSNAIRSARVSARRQLEDQELELSKAASLKARAPTSPKRGSMAH